MNAEMGGTCVTYWGGEGRDTYRVVVGKPEVHHLEDLNLDGRIILK